MKSKIEARKEQEKVVVKKLRQEFDKHQKWSEEFDRKQAAA